ncbi:MAG: hypothetical protein J1E37_01080 [Prevotella sp.]|nr:hypothetical protein [Prevotella sp.]
MKKLLLIMMVCLITHTIYAQEDSKIEKVRPITNVEVSRKVVVMSIEDKSYSDVVVNIQALAYNPWLENPFRVKVVVTDSIGKIIYKRKFKNTCLYILRNGQIQVGKPNFNKMVLLSPIAGESLYGIIKEKEGVYYW